MQNETQQCQNCEKDFIIESDDFGFYEKIKVPPPTFCPECRLIRRLAWRNDLCFYNRTCDLCGKNIVSLYHKDKKLTVYCNKCWWSDKWDAKSYGRDIDFSRPFFEQFRELQNGVPLMALFNDDGVGSVNCEYTQNVTFAKNCYMVSMSWFSEDVMYSYVISGPESRDIMDGTDIFTHAQKIYDSIFTEHSYNCRNCYFSTGLNDCAFMYDCKGCSDCFMCVNLRQKKYCILNKQYTKEEYEKIIKGYKLDTYSGNEKAKKEFFDFLLKHPRRFAYLRNCKDSTGNGLIDCKNVKDSFMAYACENMRYLWRGTWLKDSYDLSPGGKSEECYEALTADHDYRTLFTIYSLKSQEITYTENCHSSKHLFGCSVIKHGQYCILNKEYSKEEYFKLRDKLIEHMKKTGEYGEFFPAEMSNFGYNETMAQEYFPLSKEEAIKQGFKWWDDIQKTIDKGTMTPEEIPDSINDVSDSILEEVLSCVECDRNYKIIQNELNFYRKHSIPIPRKCFYCRNSERIKFENPFKLWHRKCMQEGCENEFETNYAPERLEKVYCEKCYNKEVY
jgi:hypothetical protein